MLTGKLALHDVRDAEAFCARLIPNQWRDQLEPHDEEDLLAYLVETCWELSLTYRPGHIAFSTLAGTTLRRRLTDWLRNRSGRTVWKFADYTYEREAITVLSADTDQGRSLVELRGSVSNRNSDTPFEGSQYPTDRTRTWCLTVLRSRLHPPMAA